MSVRDVKSMGLSAMRPMSGGMCILMACADVSEADQVSRQLLELNMGCLVTYRRAEDMMYNAPTGEVALVILATEDQPPMIRRTLRWLRNRWPGCPITVVGNEGCDGYEMAARGGGANYLVRPVAHEQWMALLSHALGVARRMEPEKSKQLI